MQITLKDPDGFDYFLTTAVAEQVKEGYSDEDAKVIYEHLYDELFDKLHKWFSSGEYLTVEYDTTILPNTGSY